MGWIGIYIYIYNNDKAAYLRFQSWLFSFNEMTRVLNFDSYSSSHEFELSVLLLPSNVDHIISKIYILCWLFCLESKLQKR